jgi:hypothetical protein
VIGILILIFIPARIVVVNEVPDKSLAEVIVEVARLYDIDEIRFLATAKCESSLNPSAVGDGGDSFGIFQIHLPSHPTVTAEEALDAVWAIQWSAEKFKTDPTIWVCYNKLYE